VIVGIQRHGYGDGDHERHDKDQRGQEHQEEAMAPDPKGAHDAPPSDDASHAEEGQHLFCYFNEI
jgi:hypothetical protein